jgi:predicted phosphohydrolase
MKIQYASDLHLEFPENNAFLGRTPLKVKGDVLLLAGDIVPLSQIDSHNGFFNFLSDNFNVTYWVPGNHEYYHSDIVNKGGYLNEKIRENIFLVNNTMISVGETAFVFSTLWTKIGQDNQMEIELRFSDFHVIRHAGRLLSIKDYNSLHEQSLLFMKEQLPKVSERTTIVVTHHVPTFMNYPEIFPGDTLNEAFAVELGGLIKETKPDYWIFGHSHANRGDFMIGNTGMLTNTLGYVMYNEHELFDRGRVIEV